MSQPKKTKVTHDMPEYVKHPVTPIEGGWLLGLVVPNERGYTPNGGFCPGTYAEACVFCDDEAALRGISNEAVEAVVASSMQKNPNRGSFHRCLQLILDHQAKQQAALSPSQVSQ